MQETGQSAAQIAEASLTDRANVVSLGESEQALGASATTSCGVLAA